MIHGPYQTRGIFPQWDSNIPRLGLKYSHVGNVPRTASSSSATTKFAVRYPESGSGAVETVHEK